MLRAPELATVAAHWGTYRYRAGDKELYPDVEDPDPSLIGSAMLEAARHPLRIRRPAVRRGYLGKGTPAGRGTDDHVDLPWDEALDLAAGAYARTLHDHGNEAIFGGSYGWASAGRFHHAQSQLHRFLNGIGGYTRSVGTYSHGTAEILLPHVIGSLDGLMGGHTPWETIAEHADLVVAFGGTPWKNSQINAGGLRRHQLTSHLARFAERGVDLINVGPIAGDIPEAGRPEWMPVRPGTDVALMLGLAHVLMEEGLADRAFLASHTEGFGRFESYLSGRSDRTPKTPEWAAPICSISAGDIRALARRMARGRTFLMMAWSLQRADFGEQPFWMLITLAAILGQIGLPGGGFGFGYGALDGTGRRAPVRWPSFPQGRNPVESFIPVARIADMLLSPGESYEFNGAHHDYPDIRLVHWAGGNPFHHHQDLGRLEQAWQRPETVIVQDQVWTPTARRADIVFPVLMQIERDDICCSSRDGLLSPSHRILAPYGEARSNFAILSGLAERLGTVAAFTEGLDEEGWIRRLYEDARSKLAEAGHDAPDFERFWSGGPLEFLGAPNTDLMAGFRADPKRNPLATPSGRIEVFSERVAGFGYEDCPGHPAWLPPHCWEEDGLHLLSNQPSRKLHSQLDFAAYSKAGRVGGYEPLTMHPADAARLGVAEDDRILVASARGGFQARAVLSERIRPGVVQAATGAWYDPDREREAPFCRNGNVNAVTRDEGTSRLTQGSSAQSCKVSIRRLQPDSASEVDPRW